MAKTGKKKFVMQGYTKSELGHLYFPNIKPISAWKKLYGYMMKNRFLRSELNLDDYYYFNNLKWLNKNMVEIIVRHIGEP